MITHQKIEEWIKEVEQRPETAPVILQYLANRLQELSTRNEQLLAENILLETGKRVEDYENRINHLEYQLALLKRQLGGEWPGAEGAEGEERSVQENAQKSIQILVFHPSGRILRTSAPLVAHDDGLLCKIQAGKDWETEPPRLLVVSDREELLLGFTSGRIAMHPVAEIQAMASESASGAALNWNEAHIPEELRGNERLACILPISTLALAESFIQISRKGYAKKIRTSMAQSILSNRYIGTGVLSPPDKLLEILLCKKNEHIILVSREGYLQCVDERSISPYLEEMIRLGMSDYLVSGFIAPPEKSILLMTQIGKCVLKSIQDIELAAPGKSKGQAMISAQRREKGVRIVSAFATDESEWAVSLDQGGSLSFHAMKEILNTGVVPTTRELVAFTAFSA